MGGTPASAAKGVCHTPLPRDRSAFGIDVLATITPRANCSSQTSAALLVVLAFTACKRRDAPEARSLLVITELRGTTEPCGCTSHPLGGLDRLAARVDAHRDAGVSGLLIAGNTYYRAATSPEHVRTEDEARAEVIRDIVRRLAPLAIVSGPLDVTRGVRETSNTVITQLGSAVRAVIMPRETLDAAVCKDARRLSAIADVDVRILLLGEDTSEARACDSGVDIVVAPGGETPHEPRIIGSSLWIDAGDQGGYLGELTFHPGPPGPWVFFDEGRGARIVVNAKRERLMAEIEALDEGPAKQARRAKLESLSDEVATPEPPQGRYVTWQRETIDRTIAPAPWATAKLRRFNASLCDMARDQAHERTCEEAAEADQYVGSKACEACHLSAFAFYRTTRHAQAWATLENAGKQCDLTCIGCHSVGYEKPGGYCRLEDVDDFRNVGCESCHGPGRGHAMNPKARDTWSPSFHRDAGADICISCHTHEHSDRFDFATYLPRIVGPGHGAAPAP